MTIEEKKQLHFQFTVFIIGKYNDIEDFVFIILLQLFL